MISSASLSTYNLTLSGYVGSSMNQVLFANSRVEFYISDNTTSNASGQTYLGFLTSDTNGAFSGTFNVAAYSGTISSASITATATDPTGNSSEFSAVTPVTQGVTFAVLADSATTVEAGGINNGTAGINPNGNVLTNDTGTGNTVIGVQAGVGTGSSTGVGTAIPGNYGSITISSTGAFTYTLNNSNSSVQALKSSATTLNDIFTYTARSSSFATANTQINRCHSRGQ